MTRQDFLDMHGSCVRALQTYFVEAEKTTLMLANFTGVPLSFTARFELMSQEIVEKEAHTSYLRAKGTLYEATRLGFEA